jgi:hypothetical protein
LAGQKGRVILVKKYKLSIRWLSSLDLLYSAYICPWNLLRELFFSLLWHYWVLNSELCVF